MPCLAEQIWSFLFSTSTIAFVVVIIIIITTTTTTIIIMFTTCISMVTVTSEGMEHGSRQTFKPHRLVTAQIPFQAWHLGLPPKPDLFDFLQSQAATRGLGLLLRGSGVEMGGSTN